MERLYRAWVWPIYQGHWQERQKKWRYTKAHSAAQAGLKLRVNFPPPDWHVEPVILDQRQFREVAKEVSKKITGDS